MAWFLSAVISCDKAVGKVMAELLGRDTRPDFIEDVPQGWEKFYSHLDSLDFPISIMLKKDLLYVEWHDDETQVEDLEALMKSCPEKALIKVAYYVPDEPMSGDEEDEEDVMGHVFAMRNGRLVKLKVQEIERLLVGQRVAKVSESNSDKILFILAGLL